MENSENPNPQEKKSLDDSLKLAIREEIEKEVEKRIQKQEGFYWKFLALFGGFVAVFAYALWHVQLNERIVAGFRRRWTSAAFSSIVCGV
jgi:glycyl-tRNA synthetase (class II)